MKTKEELTRLSGEVNKAIWAYHDAIASNLIESGREHNVIGDDEDYDGIILKIRDDDSVDTILVDKVRWDKDKKYVEYHQSEFNYEKSDLWIPIGWLGDEIDYIYEAIEW